MTTLERTISMIKTLPEADLAKVEALINKLQRKRDPIEEYFPKLTAEELKRSIEKSEAEYKRGECIEMGQALEMLRAKYGF